MSRGLTVIGSILCGDVNYVRWLVRNDGGLVFEVMVDGQMGRKVSYINILPI